MRSAASCRPPRRPQAADWRVRGDEDSGFTLRNHKTDKSLALGLGGRLVTSGDPDPVLVHVDHGLP